jgi:hypothetical protein
MGKCPIDRVAKMVTYGREVLDDHASTCGDRVLAFALSMEDHEALAIVELWGIPVLGSEALGVGRLRLICESDSVLIPPFDTVADVEEAWDRYPARAALPEDVERAIDG